MSKNNFIALVLSPITDTITRARKTRELWAASFVFSRLMYQLLAHRPGAATVVAPAFDPEKMHAYGAGIYHDRCIVQLPEGAEIDVGNWIAKARKALAGELGTSEGKLKNLVKIDALSASWEPGQLAATAQGKDAKRKTDDAIAIHRINRLLDNLELRPVYIPEETEDGLVDLLNKKIQKLYALGHQKGTSLFLPMKNNTVGRLPSLPEIGLRELWEHKDERIRNIYKRIVQQPTDDRITALTALGGRGKDLKSKVEQLVYEGAFPTEYLEDSQLFNELFFQYLKQELNQTEDLKGTIKFRHKYVAVVQLDGDGLGKAITRISADDPDGSKFNAFSRRLLQYADAAVKMVVDYGGLPIYAGGDDLLFLAPVAMPDSGTATNVLSLCANLDELFREKMEDKLLTISGGVFISYYKFPLGEAVKAAADLEHQAKKFAIYDNSNRPEEEKNTDDWKPTYKKQAITLEVRKHSGQTFGTTFHLGSCSFSKLEKIITGSDQIDESFLTAAMHRLESMPALLAAVAKDADPERRAAFREHQFGKGGPKHEGEYLKAVLEYAHAVFQDYGDALPLHKLKDIQKKLEKDNRTVDAFHYHLTERVFAALRFKQFLIMPDHD